MCSATLKMRSPPVCTYVAGRQWLSLTNAQWECVSTAASLVEIRGHWRKGTQVPCGANSASSIFVTVSAKNTHRHTNTLRILRWMHKHEYYPMYSQAITDTHAHTDGPPKNIWCHGHINSGCHPQRKLRKMAASGVTYFFVMTCLFLCVCVNCTYSHSQEKSKPCTNANTQTSIKPEIHVKFAQFHL